MRSRFVLGLVLGAAALCAGSGVRAHHSFPVHFVPGELVTVSGVVTQFRFRNPHGLLSFTVKNEAGEEVQWRAETNAPAILRRRGWTEMSIEPGDEVTVEGYPARDGSNFMRVYKVTFADGRELVGQRPDPAAAAGAED